MGSSESVRLYEPTRGEYESMYKYTDYNTIIQELNQIKTELKERNPRLLNMYCHDYIRLKHTNGFTISTYIEFRKREPYDSYKNWLKRRRESSGGVPGSLLSGLVTGGRKNKK